MLTETEIETLIELKILQPQDFDKLSEWGRLQIYFQREEEKDMCYALADEEINYLLFESLDNYIYTLFLDSNSELVREVENKVKLSLPSIDTRKNVLEEIFNSEVKMLKSMMSSWEYPYIDENDLLDNFKINYSNKLDKVLTLNPKNFTFLFNFSLNIFKGLKVIS